ncbi:hypothetical protein [Alkalimonas sp.]|uniref:hypothetical protein n=1 Tax=Alkalimonas sp. TaxID=1872453 RepID=UPI00263B5711|nr:hypothetical protein [Alkalimonas sp.]
MQYWPASSPLAEIKRDFSFNVFGVLLVTVFWLICAFLLLGALSYFESNWVATPLALFFFVCTSWWLYERMRLLYSREMLLVGDKGALYAWQESTGRILRYKPLPYCQLLQVTLERGKSGHYVQLKRPGLNLAVSMGGDEAQCRAAYEALSQALHYFNYRNKSQ